MNISPPAGSENDTSLASITGPSGHPVRSGWQPVLDRAATWSLPRVPTVVVVPHPDDEVLITGGLIALQRDRGLKVRIVAVTDGEAAYDSDTTVEEDRRCLAARRRREQLAALEGLGVGRADVDRLGIPDGRVVDHLDDLTDWIAEQYPHHLVVAPWIHDHHPDHEACGRAATAAAERADQLLVYGFFWTWHRVDPSHLDGDRLLRLQLPKRVRRQRARAIIQHASQLARAEGDPVLTEQLIEPVKWHDEFYAAAPRPARWHDLTTAEAS